MIARWACRPRIRPAVYLGGGECLYMAAAVLEGPEPGPEVVDAALSSFERGGLAPLASLASRSDRARAAALVLGGLVVVSECPPGPPTPVARVYSPRVAVPERPYIDSDRGVIEAFTTVVRGLSLPRGSLRLAPSGLECLPPYVSV